MSSLKDGTRQRVLVTGSHGLIGSALTRSLTHAGYSASLLDLRAGGVAFGDVRDPAHVARALEDCIGVVHLAAVSRVIDGERRPEECWETNVEGTRNIVREALGLARRPWFIYASSREVYGEPCSLPVMEDAPLRPMNIYGRSKTAAEEIVSSSDLNATVVRFSNVYGSTGDHADRVVPAFARQAAEGHPLRVDGSGHTFDFTHLDDTVRGVMAVIAKLDGGERLPPFHFVTGQPTTLGQLANLAVELAGSRSPIHEAPPRSFDVAGFYGDPSRAKDLLGWTPQVPLREGLARLIQDFQKLRTSGVA